MLYILSRQVAVYNYCLLEIAKDPVASHELVLSMLMYILYSALRRSQSEAVRTPAQV